MRNKYSRYKTDIEENNDILRFKISAKINLFIKKIMNLNIDLSVNLSKLYLSYIDVSFNKNDLDEDNDYEVYEKRSYTIPINDVKNIENNNQSVFFNKSLLNNLNLRFNFTNVISFTNSLINSLSLEVCGVNNLFFNSSASLDLVKEHYSNNYMYIIDENSKLKNNMPSIKIKHRIYLEHFFCNKLTIGCTNDLKKLYKRLNIPIVKNV